MYSIANFSRLIFSATVVGLYFFVVLIWWMYDSKLFFSSMVSTLFVSELDCGVVLKNIIKSDVIALAAELLLRPPAGVSK